LQDIPQPAVVLDVELVEDDPVGVEAVLGLNVGAENHVNAKGGRDEDRATVYLAPLEQLRTRLDHLFRNVEDERGLRAIRGGAVDFRPGLIVAEQEQEGDAGGKQRFPILPSDLQIEHPVTARPIRSALPPEQLPDDFPLPLGQHEGLPGPFALDVTEVRRKEVGRLVGSRPVEV